MEVEVEVEVGRVEGLEGLEGMGRKAESGLCGREVEWEFITCRVECT